MEGGTFEKGKGKRKQPTDEEAHKADHLEIVTFATFTTNKGKPYYAFLAVKPSRYKDYVEKTAAREPIRLRDYGTIIADGYGKVPPPEVLRDIENRYGVLQIDYEEKLIKEAKGLQHAFMDKTKARHLDNIAAMRNSKRSKKRH